MVRSEGDRLMPMIGTRALLLTTVLGFVLTTTLAQSNPPTSHASFADASGIQSQEQTASTGQAAKSADTKADGDYVGSDTCITCHEDQNRRFNRTAMGKAMAHPHTPDEARGCESCHGPGRVHVEAGGGKDTIPIRFGKDSSNTVAEKNAVCMDCHSRGTHMFWRGSPHESRGMACVDCHQVKAGVHVTGTSEARYDSPLTDNR